MHHLLPASDKGKVRQLIKSEYTATEILGKIIKSLKGRHEYNYCKNGNLTEEYYYDKNNEYIGKDLYKYDNYNKLICIEHYKAQGDLNYKEVYEYEDFFNEPFEISDCDSQGQYLGKRTYKYDEKGNTIEFVEYFGAESDTIKFFYHYDEKNNLIEESWIFSFGSVDKHIYKYDPGGSNLEEWKWYENDVLKEEITYIYDENNRLAKEHRHNFRIKNKENNGIYIFSYEENGNVFSTLIYRAKTEADLPVLSDISTCEYIYYD